MPTIDCKAAHQFSAAYKPGDTVCLDDSISGTVTRVAFTVGRDIPVYTVEWFHNGQINSGEFFPQQIKG